MSGFIDISGGVTLTINGNTYTNNATDINIQQTLPVIPRGDERRPKFEPCLIIGSIDLSLTEFSVFTWEARLGDFKRGNLVSAQTSNNLYQVRVAGYEVQEYDPTTGAIASLRINLTCLLGLINKTISRPRGTTYGNLASIVLEPLDDDFSSIGVGFWDDVIRLVGQLPVKADGTSYLTSDNFSLPNDRFSENDFKDAEGVPKGEFNPAETIASISYVRGYLTYVDPADEKVKLSLYPQNPIDLTPDYRAAIEQVETFNPSLGTEDPADQVEAEIVTQKPRRNIVRFIFSLPDEVDETGDESIVDDQAQSVDTWPKTIVSAANGSVILASRTEQRPSISSTVTSQSYSESARRSYLFKDLPDDTEIQWLTGNLTRKNHPIYGLPVSEIRTEQVAKGVLSDAIFPEVETKAGRRLERYWSYSNLGDGRDGILTRETETLFLPRSVILEDENEPDTLEKAYVQGRIYQEETPGQWVSKPFRLVPDIDNLSTNLIRDPEFSEAWEYIDGVPSPPANPVEDIEESETNTGEANAESDGNSQGLRLKVVVKAGNRPQLAKTVASTALAMSQHNKLVYDVVRPERVADSFTPGLREDVRDCVLIRTGHFIRINNEGVRFGYTGLKAATLATPVTLANPTPSPTSATAVYRSIEAARLSLTMKPMTISASTTVTAESALINLVMQSIT